MNKRKMPRDPDDTASYGELKMYYKRAIEELDECHRNKRASEQLSRSRYGEASEAKTEAKKAKRNLVTLTRREKAKSEMNKAGAWSGGAAVCVTLFYEVCKAANQWPFGRQYEPVWTHEAMVSTMTFLMTALFAFVYKSMHPESK